MKVFNGAMRHAPLGLAAIAASIDRTATGFRKA